MDYERLEQSSCADLSHVPDEFFEDAARQSQLLEYEPVKQKGKINSYKRAINNKHHKWHTFISSEYGSRVSDEPFHQALVEEVPVVVERTSKVGSVYASP